MKVAKSRSHVGAYFAQSLSLALGVLFLHSLAFGSATNFYITPNGVATGNCPAGTSTAPNVALSSMSSSNWGAGTGQIGPGTTVLICGTITGAAGATGLTVQSSGSSGSPILIKFDTNAVLQAPYWSGNGAIYCSGRSYITLDGGTNGIIQNTANGSALTYQETNTVGVEFHQCPHGEIKNLTIRNIYVHTLNSSGTGGSEDIDDEQGDFQLIHNNNVSYAYAAIQGNYDTVASGHNYTSFQVYDNTVDHACHMMDIGDNNNNGSENGLSIYGNVIGPHYEEWASSGQSCHFDGIFLNAFNSGSLATNTNIYDNLIAWDACNGSSSNDNCTALITLEGLFQGANIYNNVMYTTDPNATFEGMIKTEEGVGGGQSGDETDIHVYNNVFGGDQNNACQECPAWKVSNGGSGSQTGYISENNIFIDFSLTGITNDTNNGETIANIFTTIDHDEFYGFGNSQNETYNLITGYTTLAAAQAAGFELHGSSGNPDFNCQDTFGSNCYQIGAGSAAIGLGANLTSLGISSLNSDLDGSARPSTGNWDAGAYELQGVAVAPPTDLTAAAH